MATKDEQVDALCELLESLEFPEDCGDCWIDWIEEEGAFYLTQEAVAFGDLGMRLGQTVADAAGMLQWLRGLHG